MPANSRLLLPCNEAGEPKKALSAPTPTGRIAGYDLARAVAILGMLLVNFDSIADPVGGDPVWLRSFIDWITGRAAVIFVVLAGVGISLKVRSVRRTDGPSGIRRFRLALLKRGMALFVVGIFFNLIWPADILHFYGVYMAVGAALLTAPQRRLLITALMSIFISTLWLTLFDADAEITGLNRFQGFFDFADQITFAIF